jgi:hypothetical protein
MKISCEVQIGLKAEEYKLTRAHFLGTYSLVFISQSLPL